MSERVRLEAVGAMRDSRAEEVSTMNHDYSHCLDFKRNCPKDCFRAQLQRDLMQRFLPIPLTYTHFKGTKECPRNKEARGESDEL